MTRGPFHRMDTTLRGVKDLGIHFKGDYFSMYTGTARSVYSSLSFTTVLLRERFARYADGVIPSFFLKMAEK